MNYRITPLAIMMFALHHTRLLAASVPEEAMRLNRDIMTNRTHLQIIATQYLQTDELSEEDFLWLKNLADRYGLEPRQRGDQSFFNALSKRVDIVPPSLLAAHALLEGRQNTKSSGDFRRCAPCRSLQHPAAGRTDWPAIFHAVNQGSEFEGLRQKRANLRLAGQTPQGAGLSMDAGSLISGPGYGQRLQRVSQVLHLARLDRETATDAAHPKIGR